MKFLKYFSLMILLSVVNSDSEDICTTKSFEPTSENVKSSNDIKIQEFPFLASYGHYEEIKKEWKWQHACTASVLTKRTLLTAAHCFKTNAPQDNSVILGQNDLNSETGSNSVQEISISHGISHPEYDNVSAYFDVAIIHTDEDIEFDNEFGVKPACLSNETFKTTDFLQNENRENYLAGWGIKSETEIYAPSILSSSSLNLFTEETCNSSYDISGSSKIAQHRKKFLPNLFNSEVICAGSTVYDVGSCKGDSGAPLIEIINKGGQSQVLIRGVVHGCIGGCCSKEYPTVFANLADKKIWNFVMKEGLNPITIYVDKKNAQISDKKKKEKDKSKFYFDKTIKFKGQEINLDLEVKKKHAYIGGGVGVLVFILIVGTVIYCCCIRRKRRQGQVIPPSSPNQQQYPLTSQNSQPLVVNINVATPQ